MKPVLPLPDFSSFVRTPLDLYTHCVRTSSCPKVTVPLEVNPHIISEFGQFYLTNRFLETSHEKFEIVDKGHLLSVSSIIDPPNFPPLPSNFVRDSTEKRILYVWVWVWVHNSFFTTTTTKEGDREQGPTCGPGWGQGSSDRRSVEEGGWGPVPGDLVTGRRCYSHRYLRILMFTTFRRGRGWEGQCVCGRGRRPSVENKRLRDDLRRNGQGVVPCLRGGYYPSSTHSHYPSKIW